MKVSPLMGETLSKYLPSTGSTKSPFIKCPYLDGRPTLKRLRYVNGYKEKKRKMSTENE